MDCGRIGRRKRKLEKEDQKLKSLLGVMWKEDVYSRHARAPYPLRPVAPFFCRRSGRLLTEELPHAIVLRALRLAGLWVPEGTDVDRRGRTAKRRQQA